MLPADESFLSALQPADLDGNLNLREKEMLLATLRFFFGPAQGWGAVHDVSDPASLAVLNTTLRLPGERYDLLEQGTSLPGGFFGSTHVPTAQAKLHATKRDNAGLSPSYFLYESQFNLSLYVGPDLLHGLPGHLVINTLVLGGSFAPQASFTLRS